MPRRKEKLYPYVIRSADVLHKVQEARKMVGRGLVTGEVAEMLAAAADTLFSWLMFRIRDSHVAIPPEHQERYDLLSMHVRD